MVTIAKQRTYRFGELKSGGIRICECGEFTLEDESHLCVLTDVDVPDPNDGIKHIVDLEDAKAMKDMGKMGKGVYDGVIEEGGTIQEAVSVTAAYFAGMFMSVKKDDDEETPSS